jgi:molybdate/tungstate transport system substrate-binding protein
MIAVLIGVLLVAGCRPSTPPSSTVAPAGSARDSAASAATGASGKSLSVLYAGSLVNLMETGVGPAFQRETGVAYEGQGAGSVALANAIKDKTRTADVFISADPAVNRNLMGAANDDWVSWYILFARTSMVIGYNPNSRFAPDFERVKGGSLPWYQVLQTPGLKLGRTDPNLDPKGYRTLFLFDLAQGYHRLPGLRENVLGEDANPEQIFPEEILETRLETGALDAGLFYLNEAAEKGLPYVTLPDEINQSNPAMAATYATATFTNARGQAFRAGPIVYTATVLRRARDPAAGETFVRYLLSTSGQGIMREHGLLSTAVLFGGDKSVMPATLVPLAEGEYAG